MPNVLFSYPIKVKEKTTVFSEPGYTFRDFEGNQLKYPSHNSTTPEKVGFLTNTKGTPGFNSFVEYAGSTESKYVRLPQPNNPNNQELKTFYKIKFYKKSSGGKNEAAIGWVIGDALEVPSDLPTLPFGKIMTDISEVQKYGCMKISPSWLDDPENCTSWEKKDQDSFIKGVQALCQGDQNCETNLRKDEVRKLASFEKEVRQDATYIPAKCVAASVFLGTYLKKNNRFYCESDKKGESPAKNHTHCITSEMIQYLTMSVNLAMKCMNSDGEGSLDPMDVFKLINHESSFHTNIIYKGGQGLMQLTTNGASDLKQYGGHIGPGKREWDKIKDNPECSLFKPLIHNQFPYLDHKAQVKSCQFINADTGIMRSAIAGLSLYKAYLTSARTKMKKELFESESEYEEAIKVAARVSYNAGPGSWEESHKALRLEETFSLGELDSDKYRQLIENQMPLDRSGNPFRYASEVNIDYSGLNNQIEKASVGLKWNKYLKNLAKKSSSNAPPTVSDSFAETLYQKVDWVLRNGVDKHGSYLRKFVLEKEFGLNLDESQLNELFEKARDYQKIRQKTQNVDPHGPKPHWAEC